MAMKHTKFDDETKGDAQIEAAPGPHKGGKGKLVCAGITAGLFVAMVSLGLVLYFDIKAAHDTEFAPTRILLDASEGDDQATLQVDFSQDGSFGDNVDMTDAICSIKMPTCKQDSCAFMTATYHGGMAQHPDDADSKKVRIPVRLTTATSFSKMISSMKDLGIGLSYLNLECAITLAYTRFSALVAPEYVRTYTRTLGQMTGHSSSTGQDLVDAEKTHADKYSKTPLVHAGKRNQTKLGFARTSSHVTRPRIQNLNLTTNIEGIAQLYIAPGKEAVQVASFLKRIAVEVAAEVTYEENSLKAFDVAATMRGRFSYKIDEFGAVMLSIPLTAMGRIDITATMPLLGGAMRGKPSSVIKDPETGDRYALSDDTGTDHSIMVSNQPRSFVGNLFGSEHCVGVRGNMTSDGAPARELRALLSGKKGLFRELQTEIERGVMSLNMDLSIFLDNQDFINVGVDVVGGTPMMIGTDVTIFSLEDVFGYEYVNGAMAEVNNGWESTRIHAAAQARMDTDANIWDGEVKFTMDSSWRKIERGYNADMLDTGREDLGVTANFSYANKKVNVGIAMGMGNAQHFLAEPGWTGYIDQDPNSSDNSTVLIEAVFRDEFPSMPVSATIIADIFVEEIPKTTIAYTMTDNCPSTTNCVETFDISVDMDPTTLQVPANQNSLFALPNQSSSSPISTLLSYVTTMGVTSKVVLDKSNALKWNVTADYSMRPTCTAMNNAALQTTIADTYRGGGSLSSLASLTAPTCSTCSREGEQCYIPELQRMDDCCTLPCGWGSCAGAWEEASCCNGVISVDMADMMDASMGETKTGKTSMLMDPIEFDTPEGMIMGMNTDDEDVPVINLDSRTVNDVWFLTGSVEADNKQVGNMNFRFAQLNDMELNVFIDEAILVNVTANETANLNELVHNMLWVSVKESDHTKIIEAVVNEWHSHDLVGVNAADGKINLAAAGQMKMTAHIIGVDEIEQNNEIVKIDKALAFVNVDLVTAETATTNMINMSGSLDVDSNREANVGLLMTGDSGSWMIDAKVNDSEGKVQASAGSDMTKVGQHFSGDVWVLGDSNSESDKEHVHLVLSEGFLPVAVPSGHDQFDMNVSLGQGPAATSNGIEDVGGDFAWYLRRGPGPIRDVSGTGVTVHGYEMTGSLPQLTKTPKFTMSADIGTPYMVQASGDATVAQVTAFATEVAMENPEDFDEAKFIQSVAQASGVDASSVVVESIEYHTTVEYSFPAVVTEAQATTAIAATASVVESRVTVVITPGAVSGGGRRLAGSSVAATITSPNAADLNLISVKVADVSVVKTQIVTAGVTAMANLAVTVSVAPKKIVKANTKITSGGGAPPVEAPSDGALAQSLAQTLGVPITVKTVVDPVVQTATVTTTMAGIITAAPGNRTASGATAGAGHKMICFAFITAMLQSLCL